MVDADVAFWIEPDGHISGPFSDEHIEWDHDAARWRLVHDDEDEPAPPALPEHFSCGMDLGRDEYPFTCGRRVAHQGVCSGDLDSGLAP
ncbi:hypothetical protein NKH18_01385 [Streptomyces sp. M10(2022)]